MIEKYGVVTEKQKPGEKHAADETGCPLCGEELEKTANVPKCPKHGTAPFEKPEGEGGENPEKG